MKIPTSKIVIGGAQLGSKYGITNRLKKMSMSEVEYFQKQIRCLCHFFMEFFFFSNKTKLI